MKMIKLTSAAVLASIAFGNFATTVLADDVANYDSTGTITYVPSTDPTDPVDPLDPEGPGIDPENPDGSLPEPGTPGPLSIDFASSFDFGIQEITSSDMTYNAAAQKLSDGTTRPNYVQVTDNRGTLAGWNLSVTQEEQFSTGDTGVGSELSGASMTLGNGHIVSASANPADKFAASTTLVPGTQSGIILGASDGVGTGTNLLVFGDESTEASSVTLAVPGSTTKLAQGYSTNLTWTLSDTPA
ncbi:MAG: WxL domain-containing protein [Streptococcaceae bacterium]|nr:WxL domain-containing protein [Streptococcaceae bacterium]